MIKKAVHHFDAVRMEVAEAAGSVCVRCARHHYNCSRNTGKSYRRSRARTMEATDSPLINRNNPRDSTPTDSPLQSICMGSILSLFSPLYMTLVALALVCHGITASPTRTDNNKLSRPPRHVEGAVSSFLHALCSIIPFVMFPLEIHETCDSVTFYFMSEIIF